MSTSQLAMMLLGLGFGAGLCLLAAALHNPPSNADEIEGRDERVAFHAGRQRRARTRGAAFGRRQATRGGLCVLAGAAAWLLTGWPVAGLLSTGVLVVVPWLFGAGKITARRLDRIDALAAWCRRLRDLVATGQVSVLQAMRESAATAPAPIAVEVTDLAARLRGWEFTAALRRFADEIDDPVGDQIAAALIIAYCQGSGVSRVLSSLAASVDVEVAARADIEAQRAGPRKTARILVYIYLGLLGMLTVNGSYLRPYDSLLGQLIMLVLSGIVLGALVWLRQLSLGGDATRFLIDEHHRGDNNDGGGTDEPDHADAAAGGALWNVS